ncbi:MAG: cytochrome P450 [Acidimicrobiales bacterium]|nr:cytochrome P450 [Acidimicrobiales bacterium]
MADELFELEESFLDPAVQDDPFDTYTTLHEKCPVYKVPENGLYMVTKYEDVREVLTTPSIYSSRPGTGAGGLNEASKAHAQVFQEKGWVKGRTLQRTDPPEHSHYRKILGRVFTNRAVEGMIPRIDEITHSLIDQFIDRGQCEFVSEFALPLPGIFICEQLGLPAEEYETFKKWADAMLAMSQRPLSPDEAVIQAEYEVEAQHHLAREFEKRREEPTDDLISALVHAHQEDEPFTMEELQDLMHQLVTGGFETTTAAIGTSMWLLLRYPDQMQKLRDDRSLQKNFIEESLRFDSPVAGLWRTAACPAEIGGASIPEGSAVMPRFAAANRDAEVFESPEVFDITREDLHKHVAFGLGSHFCMGASLARAELMSAFTAILDRMDNIRLAKPLDDNPHKFSFFLRPMKELHIEFDKI